MDKRQPEPQSSFRARHLTYGAEADVSPATASADFRRLVDAGLVVQHGRGRNVSYVAAEDLQASTT